MADPSYDTDFLRGLSNKEIPKDKKNYIISVNDFKISSINNTDKSGKKSSQSDKQKMCLLYLSVMSRLEAFKLDREQANKKEKDNKLNLQLLLTKVIKKEVYDQSDTMDVLAQVIHRMDKRMASIERTLGIAQGASRVS